MYQQAQPGLWQGRVDSEDGDAAKRWHQQVRWLDLNSSALPRQGCALIGFCCDEGVRRNQGRPGARHGPDAIRRVLAGLAWHGQHSPLFDAGNIVCPAAALEASQDALTDALQRLLQAGLFPIVLGGGHEVAYASGRAACLEGSRTGIINFDAHFDLRLPLSGASSGTAFYQLSQEGTLPFRYLCLGVSEAANTAALFARARTLQARWLLDTDMHWARLANNLAVIDRFMADCDRIYLSIDLDVLPAATMPAVSAPAARGVGLDYLELLLARIIDNHHQGSARVILADLAEYNPGLDQDQQGARVAARLISQLQRLTP